MEQLTRNEKKVLKFLIENARITDTEIAKKLNITPQA
ncbi:MAG: winged helix-turn-helix transcriptional regulator, partial [Candidatus Altarchaeaceae archaeon]